MWRSLLLLVAATASLTAAFSSPRSFLLTTRQHPSSCLENSSNKNNDHHLTIIDDELSHDDYSRSLSPRQQRDQVLKEYVALYDEGPRWRRRLLRPLKLCHQRLFPKRRTKPGTLILIKSGESTWRKKGIFTGWSNQPSVKLTAQGEQECVHAARLLLEAGYQPDLISTSMLNRAIQSAWIINKEMDSIFLPVYKSWRLNERMYGSLQGISKKSASLKFGQDVVQAWRRGFKARPPALSKSDPLHPRHDRRYANIDPDLLPSSESLNDCMKRQQPLWDYRIAPALRAGSNVLVLAHANSLRGLAKIIDDIPTDAMEDVSFPSGIPFVYKFEYDKSQKHRLKTMPPQDESLMQPHTTGVFLEKPGLLEEALQRQTEWKSSVPGAAELDLAPTVKRTTTMEKSLLLLKKEQEMEQWVASHQHQQHHYNSNQHGALHAPLNLAQGTIKVLQDTGVKFIQGGEDRHSSINGSGRMGDQGEFEEPIFRNDKHKKESVVPNVARDTGMQGKGPVVVFVRHGTTPHNELGLFTGWEDPPLSETGVKDAKRAGQLLKRHGFEFDVVYTSWLSRAIETALYIQEELDMSWLPLVKSWRLNERHYGRLTGQSKKMVGNTYGQEQLKIWRRSHDIPPPKASSYSFSYPGNDNRRIKYANDLRISFTETLCRSIEAKQFEIHRKWPKAESLKMCMSRSLPFYTKKIVPEAVNKGKRVLVTSHENAIRGILMHLCEIPPEHMNDLHLPNGLPLVYDVRRKCISLLDDGTGRDPMEVYDFGSAAHYLFRPCEITDEDFARMEQSASAVVESMDELSKVLAK